MPDDSQTKKRTPNTPRRTVKATIQRYGDLLPSLKGSKEALAQFAADNRPMEEIAPIFRREQAIRQACQISGDPLVGLAYLAAATTDPEFKAAVFRAMLPYVHAQQKAVEVSGPGGEQLVIEVRKIVDPIVT